jgi:flagellin FlaB
VRHSASKHSHSGITGLETAIILIAFVVVASVFAFTVLSTGVFASERSKETIYEGVEETKTSVSPRGSTIVSTGNVAGTTSVVKVTFNVASSINSSEMIDLTPPYLLDDTGVDPDPSGLAAPSIVSYTDNEQRIVSVPWTVRFIGGDSGDYVLDEGEMAEITVWLHELDTSTDIYALGVVGDPFLKSRLEANEVFNLTFDPGQGATMDLQRTIPVRLDPFIDLK